MKVFKSMLKSGEQPLQLPGFLVEEKVFHSYPDKLVETRRTYSQHRHWVAL